MATGDVWRMPAKTGGKWTMLNRSSFNVSNHGLYLVAVSSLLAVAPSTATKAAEPVATIFETVPPGEAEQIDAAAAIMTKLQDKRRENDETQNGNLLRGVHPKSHGCVKARFTVNDDVDKKYRVGLFVQPGKSYDAWIRYSNADALRRDDLKANKDGLRENGSRGMALKILNVDGEFLGLDNGKQNQDFLMINTPQFAFSDVRSYLRLNKVLANETIGGNKGDNPSGFFLPLDTRQPFPPTGNAAWGDIWSDFKDSDRTSTVHSAIVVKNIASKTVRDPTQVQYFGAAPFLFGSDHAMKYSVAPTVIVEQKPFDEDEIKHLPEGFLRKALTATMEGDHEIALNFMIQVRPKTELTTTEIEDATTTWGKDENEEIGKYVAVARIAIPAPQEPDSQAMIEFCEQLAFTPWHSLAAHRPIGGINRIRQQVYHSSAQHRGASGF